MRAKIIFKLTCSECGRELESDPDKNKIEYDSAFESTSNFSIKPCEFCYYEAKKPARLMNEAIEILKNKG